MPSDVDDLARSELLASLSLCTDMANGLPFETALRTGLLAARLAEKSELGVKERHLIFHTGILRFLGCTGFAHEEARLSGGDDIAMRAAFSGIDRGSKRQLLEATARKVGAGAGAIGRAKALSTALLRGQQVAQEFGASFCDAAIGLSARLGGGPALSQALGQLHERWDGRGVPQGIEGNNLSLAARHVQVASVAEFHHRLGGTHGALKQLEARCGGQLDPALVALFLSDAEILLAPLAASSVWDEAESTWGRLGPWPELVELTQVAEAFADFVDLSSVYTLGHSRAVAKLCLAAADLARLDKYERNLLHQAALLHDLGRLSVPTGTWEKNGPLSRTERERVELHSHHTERILGAAERFAPLARLCGAHHERVNGTGYPKGKGGASLPQSARILGVADAYTAMREKRPHRAALSKSDAATALRHEVSIGLFDETTVSLVLKAAGHNIRLPVSTEPGSSPLTLREREVLQVVARGLSTKEAAKELGIGARTVKHHIAQIYQKTGISSRAGLAVYALERGIFQRADSPTEPTC